MLSINYNSASRNAVNQVGQAQTGIAKAMNALSTGNRINSAADDVAGSAMASRMQVQSNSLDTAVTNAHMGVNLIQTMDGAMKETNTLLQRMTKLTEMSQNEAYSTQDRDMMNQEFGALVNELDRNAQSANYNGISLINNAGNTAGSAAFDKDISKGVKFTAGNNELTFTVTAESTENSEAYDAASTAIKAAADKTASSASPAKPATLAQIAKAAEDAETAAKTAVTNDTTGDKTLVTKALVTSVIAAEAKAAVTFETAAKTATGAYTTATTTGAKIPNKPTQDEIAAAEKVRDTAIATATKTRDTAIAAPDASIGKSTITVDFGVKSLSANEIVGAINKQLKESGVDANATINSEGKLAIESNIRVGDKIGVSTISDIKGTALDNLSGTTKPTEFEGTKGFSDIVINVGSSGNEYDNIFLKTVNLSAKGLGLEGASLTNSNDLGKTLSTLKAALDTVTEQRSFLGASQKRLSFASDNLQNVKNNTDASLSSIQDTDYAATTMQLAREKVLSSASQAMLGQSNQMQSQVVQLLK